MELKNRVAFITGAGGYIGGETAVTLARQGIKIAACDIHEETINTTIERIVSEGGEAFPVVIDVTNSENVNSAVRKTVEKYGRIDISVHVAGGSARIAGKNAKYTLLVEQEDYVIDQVIKVNLYGALYVSRAVAKQMMKQGNGGKIINFSSTVGINGLTKCVEYAAAKGGVIAMTKALAKELGPYGINVNSVAPGVVARPGEDGNSDYVYKTNFLNKKCLGSDVANLVEFLASDKSDFITGQIYVIDGGRSLAMKGSE